MLNPLAKTVTVSPSTLAMVPSPGSSPLIIVTYSLPPNPRQTLSGLVPTSIDLGASANTRLEVRPRTARQDNRRRGMCSSVGGLK